MLNERLDPTIRAQTKCWVHFSNLLFTTPRHSATALSPWIPHCGNNVSVSTLVSHQPSLRHLNRVSSCTHPERLPVGMPEQARVNKSHTFPAPLRIRALSAILVGVPCCSITSGWRCVTNRRKDLTSHHHPLPPSPYSASPPRHTPSFANRSLSGG